MKRDELICSKPFMALFYIISPSCLTVQFYGEAEIHTIQSSWYFGVTP